jgi:hypothetical protein
MAFVTWLHLPTSEIKQLAPKLYLFSHLGQVRPVNATKEREEESNNIPDKLISP